MRASLALVMLGLSFGISTQLAAQSGHWEGKILAPNREIPITVELAKNASGAWIGSMSVLQSTSIDVPLGAVAVDGKTVHFTANLPGLATFDGTLSPKADSLNGTATNARGGVPFSLARGGEAAVKLPPPSSVLPKEFEGSWEGALEAGGRTLRLGVRLAPGANGLATGAFILLEEGNQEIPITTVTVTGKELALESRPISGTYRGTLGAGGEITGEWAQGPARLPLTLKRR
jgi:hypothetical protein